MKEDVFTVRPWGVSRLGTRTVARYERDPNKIWLGKSQWYWDPINCTLTHDGEQIGTCYSVGPSVLLHTELVEFGEKTPDGRIVQSPTLTWFEISNYLIAHPEFRFEFCAHPEKFEHFLAARFCIEDHNSVIVTPRSGDKGRDVIAERFGARTIEEAKAYSSPRLVRAEQLRALCYVAARDNAENAVITTTSEFAPGVIDEFSRELSSFLQTINGTQLVEHVNTVTVTQSATQLASKLFENAGLLISADANGRIFPQRQLLTWSD